MSELFKEYTHVVADPTKQWPYFDIPGCLKMLSWSVDECFGHISPQWIENSSLTRHAVVQLALYTCPPFRDAPPGCIVDRYPLKDNNEKQRQYPCPSVPALIEAFATAFMTHEAWCEYMYQWPVFKVRREDCIRFLENFLSLYRGVRQRGPLKDRRFYHKRDLEKEIKNTIKDLQAFTYDDYQHAGAPADTPGDSRAHANKYMLLRDLENAFRTYGPAEWSREATYRALAAMMNQMQIYNAKGKDWTPSAMKKFLVHGPDSGLTLKLKFTRPNIEPWYKRPG